MNSKNNSCRDNYMRKYGIHYFIYRYVEGLQENFKITGEPPSFASLKIFKQLEAGKKCVPLSLKK